MDILTWTSEPLLTLAGLWLAGLATWHVLRQNGIRKNPGAVLSGFLSMPGGQEEASHGVEENHFVDPKKVVLAAQAYLGEERNPDFLAAFAQALQVVAARAIQASWVACCRDESVPLSWYHPELMDETMITALSKTFPEFSRGQIEAVFMERGRSYNDTEALLERSRQYRVVAPEVQKQREDM